MYLRDCIIYKEDTLQFILSIYIIVSLPNSLFLLPTISYIFSYTLNICIELCIECQFIEYINIYIHIYIYIYIYIYIIVKSLLIIS